MLTPPSLERSSAMLRWRSVSMRSGSRLLRVTLAEATWRDSALLTEVSPLRAPVERPMGAIGVFTMADVMLTMRPKPRSTMPSSTERIIKTGASMLASSAAIHAARSQS